MRRTNQLHEHGHSGHFCYFCVVVTPRHIVLSSLERQIYPVNSEAYNPDALGISHTTCRSTSMHAARVSRRIYYRGYCTERYRTNFCFQSHESKGNNSMQIKLSEKHRQKTNPPRFQKRQGEQKFSFRPSLGVDSNCRSGAR